MLVAELGNVRPWERGNRNVGTWERGNAGTRDDALLTSQSPWSAGFMAYRAAKPGNMGRCNCCRQPSTECWFLWLTKRPRETRYRGDRGTENSGNRRIAHRTIAVGVAGFTACQAAEGNENRGNRRIAHRTIAVGLAGFTACQAAEGNEVSTGLGTETIQRDHRKLSRSQRVHIPMRFEMP